MPVENGTSALYIDSNDVDNQKRKLETLTKIPAASAVPRRPCLNGDAFAAITDKSRRSGGKK